MGNFFKYYGKHGVQRLAAEQNQAQWDREKAFREEQARLDREHRAELDRKQQAFILERDMNQDLSQMTRDITQNRYADARLQKEAELDESRYLTRRRDAQIDTALKGYDDDLRDETRSIRQVRNQKELMGEEARIADERAQKANFAAVQKSILDRTFDLTDKIGQRDTNAALMAGDKYKTTMGFALDAMQKNAQLTGQPMDLATFDRFAKHIGDYLPIAADPDTRSDLTLKELGLLDGALSTLDQAKSQNLPPEELDKVMRSVVAGIPRDLAKFREESQKTKAEAKTKSDAATAAAAEEERRKLKQVPPRDESVADRNVRLGSKGIEASTKATTQDRAYQQQQEAGRQYVSANPRAVDDLWREFTTSRFGGPNKVPRTDPRVNEMFYEWVGERVINSQAAMYAGGAGF